MSRHWSAAGDGGAGDGEAGPPVAVIDVGSNSVRLVVYDALGRAPVPIFNERAQCSLARGLDERGTLDPSGVEAAKRALSRFSVLAGEMGVASIDAIATAAVREAQDGESFVAAIERACGLRIRVLRGEEEARLATLGVQAACPGADGLMGDLGGGSLELVSLDATADEATTLPIGTLRTGGTDGPPGDPRHRAEIDRRLGEVDWLARHAGKSLYIVGGAWRALGHLHMLMRDHPLLVLHGYIVKAGDMRLMAALTSRLSPDSTIRLEAVSLERRATLPYAARVLASLIEASGVERVAFSAFGLREGVLVDRLSPGLRDDDPLLAGCARLAATRSRFPGAGQALASWTDRLFCAEPPAARRLRRAAALLADGAWMTHRDYRAEQAMLDTARGPFVGIDHNERARLALMVHARHTGHADGPEVAAIRRLVDEDEAREAHRVGQALRLGLTISGGLASLMEGIMLARADGRLELTVPRARRALVGDLVLRRFEALARAFDLAPELIIAD